MDSQITLGAQPRPQVTAGKLLKAMRAFSLPVSVLPVFVAVAAAVRPSAWRWDVLIVSAAGAGLLHLGGNLLNDYFDFLSKVDRRVHGDENRPGRLLVRGQLLPRHVLAEALACLLLAAAATAWLWWRCGTGILLFAAGAAAGLYAYTGPPLNLKYRMLGEPAIFAVFGPLLMVGAAWAQTGRVEISALLASIPIGLATTAILVGNNYRDRQEDGEAGIKTLAHLAGGKVIRATYLLLVPASAFGLAAIGAAGAGPRLLMLAPLALASAGKPLLAVWRLERLPDIDARTAQYETLLLLLAFVAYAIGW